jgi:hypothetical protein
MRFHLNEKLQMEMIQTTEKTIELIGIKRSELTPVISQRSKSAD